MTTKNDPNNSNGDTNGSQPLALECPNCKNLINFKQPELFLSSHPKVTTINVIHEKGEDCFKCGAYLHLTAGVVNGSIVLMPMPVIKPKEAPKIINPGNLKIPNLRGN